MTDYYTHGSIANVKIENDKLLLKIKPLNELETTVNNDRYIVLVKTGNIADPPSSTDCAFMKIDDDFDATSISLISSMLSYWLQNKTKLKFTIKDNKITSIESLNDDKN